MKRWVQPPDLWSIGVRMRGTLLHEIYGLFDVHTDEGIYPIDTFIRTKSNSILKLLKNRKKKYMLSSPCIYVLSTMLFLYNITIIYKITNTWFPPWTCSINLWRPFIIYLVGSEVLLVRIGAGERVPVSLAARYVTKIISHARYRIYKKRKTQQLAENNSSCIWFHLGI